MTYIVPEIFIASEIFTGKLRYKRTYYETQKDFENEHSGLLKELKINNLDKYKLKINTGNCCVQK